MNPLNSPVAPVIIARAEHTVSRSQVAGSALKVLYRLKESNYQAFLVGGCVRDLLLGIEPKDFDVATNASPDELRALFRNCRLIGRRFRLAHVRFGQDIIEVATFRAAHVEDDPDDVDEAVEQDDDNDRDVEAEADREIALSAPPDEQRVLDQHGRLLRDNVYGTIDEDVWRRDFTCNALYYNIEDFSVWDYVGGVEDVRNRVLRLIGDPETRYREDPVRMLRAVRFEAKLGFRLHVDSERPIATLAPLLASIPPARLFDEWQKLFLAGFARESFARLRERGLLRYLLPEVDELLDREPDGHVARLLDAGLRSTDQRVAQGRSVTPTFLFGVLLFGPISVAAQRRFDQGLPAPQAIAEACDEVLSQTVRRIALPKRFSLPLREILALQPRFHRREGRKTLNLINHPRFRAAYDFLLLRAEAGVEDPAIAQWWTDLQDLSHEERLQRVETARGEGGGSGPRNGPRRRRGRRRGGRPAETPPST